MELDSIDLKRGLKFIVGTWQTDYIVNSFSNDLGHIPASEFKSDDGNDFSAITFEFYEDHTVIMKNSATGTEEPGTWEQNGILDYHYTLGGFISVPEGAFRDAAESLKVVEGDLVFSIGFLAIALKKTADGKVTEEKDIGDTIPSDEDNSASDIVGRYCIYKAFAPAGGDLGLHTRAEVEKDLYEQKARGETDDDEIAETLSSFDMIIEFTPDHEIYTWMKIPSGASDEDIRGAIESGEIKEAKDGYFRSADTKEWKALDGKYYYDTKEEREAFGEKLSSWDELSPDEEGCFDFMSGMIKIKKI